MIPPFQNVMQIIQQVQALRQNPNQMAQFLYERQAINRQQYEEMQRNGIGGNPEAIGQYMMNHGMMNRQAVQDVYQNQALPIQNSMRQN
jgi:hypothetical protein